MKLLLLCILIFFTFSYCISTDKEGETIFSIVNNSGHKINFKAYRKGAVCDTFTLDNLKKKEYVYYKLGGYKGDPLSGVDSLSLIFDDTIAIMHKMNGTDTILVKHNLLYQNTYTQIQINNYTTQYNYFITAEDYENALH